MKKRCAIATLIFLFSCLNVYADCFESASSRYGVPSEILRAISIVESNGNQYAFNKNPNGSYDMGHMQINSSWLPILNKYGITENHLFDYCTNIYVAAWIVAQNIYRLGYTWEAIGAYNAKSHKKRLAYAKKIADVVQKIKKNNAYRGNK